MIIYLYIYIFLYEQIFFDTYLFFIDNTVG